MDDDFRYFTLDEIAVDLGVPVEKIDSVLRDFPHFRLCGSRKLFSAEDVNFISVRLAERSNIEHRRP